MPTFSPQTHPDVPPLLSPSLFSLLPDLYILLSRLSTDQSITPKDLPALVYPVKENIARAKATLASLPDMERSVRQQEEEMEILQGRIEGLRGRLGELGGIAKGAERG